MIRALRVKDRRFEYCEPSSPAELRRWSPETGQLPVIEIGGDRIVDSEAILDALDARFPEPPLLSRDPKVAREQRRLSTWVGETFRFYLIRWVGRGMGSQIGNEALDEEGNALGPLARMGLLTPEGRIDDQALGISMREPDPEFERRIQDLSSMLGERRYFHADALSRADLAVFASLLTLYRNRFVGGRALLDRHPRLIGYVERLAAETGGLELEPQASDLPAGSRPAAPPHG